VTLATTSQVAIGRAISVSTTIAIAVAAFVVSITITLAQDAAPYCGDLKRVTSLVSARDRFASIAGKPREGNFRDTVLPLTGWKDVYLRFTRVSDQERGREGAGESDR
jgi:hypothetical protein